ncbi:hypothetical protein R3P38DRAFT_3172485 [Favolaschia claudopus]|uniref:F-box domain-containing protein n=1 Tax=Favolaschia claudopus TaxID=2862362 RepID=A0AAW0DH84_9AGAR
MSTAVFQPRSFGYMGGNCAVDREVLALRATLQTLHGIWTDPDSPKYPVLTIPNEIISEIFLHFLPPPPEFPPIKGPYSPLRLLAICQKWRAIALATPGLWNMVTYLVSTRAETTRRCEALLDRSRASALPLSLRIVSRASVRKTQFSIPEPPAFCGISELDCARVEHLRLNLHGTHLSTIREHPMPLLERLELCVTEGAVAPLTLTATHPSFPGILLVLSGPVGYSLNTFALEDTEAPLLRTVILEVTFPMTINLPWEQLTSLTINAFNVEARECFTAFKRAVNLKHCVLNFPPGAETDYLAPNSNNEITWPALESLVIGPKCLLNGGRLLHRQKILNTLVVPALRSFQVPLPYLLKPPQTHIEFIEEFVGRSGCELKVLHITHVGVAVAHRLWKRQPGEASDLHAAFPHLEVCTMN